MNMPNHSLPMIPRLILILLAMWSTVSHAQPDADEEARFKEIGWEKIEAMVTARDGVRLYTEIIRPLDRFEKLPILLMRTPYNASLKFTAFTN